jgi:hypothetical protein
VKYPLARFHFILDGFTLALQAIPLVKPLFLLQDSLNHDFCSKSNQM